MLVSTYRRAGEPVAVACGTAPEEGAALRADLLLVAAHTNLERLTFRPVHDNGDRVTVTLPDAYRNQRTPARYYGVTLEAPHAESPSV